MWTLFSLSSRSDLHLVRTLPFDVPAIQSPATGPERAAKPLAQLYRYLKQSSGRATMAFCQHDASGLYRQQPMQDGHSPAWSFSRNADVYPLCGKELSGGGGAQGGRDDAQERRAVECNPGWVVAGGRVRQACCLATVGVCS